MDRTQYWNIVGNYISERPEWRRGQTLFNVLRMMDPELAKTVMGTTADPFHNNANENEFLEKTGLAFDTR